MNVDPTYDRAQIDENPVWAVAFVLSELQNDNAPVGWGNYIHIAESLHNSFHIKLKWKKKAVKTHKPTKLKDGKVRTIRL